MNEPENILATVECSEKKIAIDMELPAKLQIEDLKMKILEILRNIYAGLFTDWESCCLIYGNRILNDSETLLSAGIYDGGYIYVARS